jgi:ribosome-associated protein
MLPAALRERAVERLGARLVNGVLTITASEHRSQLRNREAAAARLAALVASAIAPPPRARRATRPSRGSVERRIAEKKRRSQTKQNRRADTD